MKLGLSSYSVNSIIASGQMSLAQAMGFAAKQGAACMELVPFAFTFLKEDGSIDEAAIRDARCAASNVGLELVNYSILADLCKEDSAAFESEIERVKLHVDIAAALGLPRMRHDISAFRRPRGENGIMDFDRLFPKIVEAATRISEHAEIYGITTMVENHGFFANGCDRVERLIRSVNRENYGLLLDTGNIACVDEDPAVAAQRLAPMANMIHLKDFYIRKRNPGDTTSFDCSGRWFQSMAGRYLRGAILAQGDLDMWEILGAIKRTGYDGAIVIEFEGFEDPLYASKVSLDNARRIWEEV